MRKLGRTLLIIAAAICLASCGSNMVTNPTGTWTATLTPSTSQYGSATAMTFSDTFTTNVNQTNNPNNVISSVSVTNLTIATNNGCLDPDATQVAGYRMDTTSNSFTLDISSTAPQGYVAYNLDLSGTLKNNTITGTWTLAPVQGVNASCTGSGSFTMILGTGSNPFPTRTM